MSIITNNGTINAGDDGIDVEDWTIVTNTSSLSINAGSDGIEVDSDNQVFNSGTINAEDDGIRVGGNDNYIENSGTINADDVIDDLGDMSEVVERYADEVAVILEHFGYNPASLLDEIDKISGVINV